MKSAKWKFGSLLIEVENQLCFIVSGSQIKIFRIFVKITLRCL